MTKKCNFKSIFDSSETFVFQMILTTISYFNMTNLVFLNFQKLQKLDINFSPKIMFLCFSFFWISTFSKVIDKNVTEVALISRNIRKKEELHLALYHTITVLHVFYYMSLSISFSLFWIFKDSPRDLDWNVLHLWCY